MDAREIKQIGPYPVKRMIAEGGMSWVFEVEDPRFGVRRALKMLKKGIAEELDERFQAEVQTLAHVEHPNVITVYDFGTDEALGCDWYTMTFVDGATLADKKNLTPREAGHIFLDVLMGLGQLHDKDITHRDLKPANVVLTADGRAVLIDLGIVHLENEPARTAPGVAMGTVLYMSPEQALGQKVGPTSDVFAAGLTLYYVLTGKSVYDDVPELDAPTGQAILMYLGSLHHAGRELDLVFPSHVPTSFRAVVERACRMQPKDRYPDARAMYAALQEALQADDSEQTKMMSAADVGRVAKDTGTGRSRLVAGGAVFAIAAGAAALLWLSIDAGWFAGQDTAPATPDVALQGSDIPAVPHVADEASRFQAAVDALLTAPNSWADLDVRFWVEPNPIPAGDAYHLFMEADCDCWPLLFSVGDSEEQITMLFPNAMESTRRLSSGVVQIPTPGDPILGGGGGVLRESEPGVHLVKLLLIPAGLEQQLKLPTRATDEAMWSVRGGDTERLAELQHLLDGLRGVRFATRTARLEVVARAPRPTASRTPDPTRPAEET